MAQRKGGGWGSFLGTAVAGLESRLDGILTDDDQASAKSRAADAATKLEAAEKQRLQPQVSRSSSRPNSRLQDRLAKAVNKGMESSNKDGTDSRPSSDLGSRPESPALRAGTPVQANNVSRTSIDSRASEPVADTLPGATDETAQPEEKAKPDTPPAEAPPVSTTPPAVVTEQPTSMAMPMMSIPSIRTPEPTSPRQSIDSARSRPSFEIPTPSEPEIAPSSDPETLQVELSALQVTHDETVRQHREELNSHLERIDALQSKLTYLSQQLAASAKATSSETEATPAEKKLADKDAQIAALMEEGQRLSKTEMKHMTTIKKMRAKALETDKDLKTLKQRLSKAENSITEHAERANRAEAAEKASQEKLKVVAKIEKDIELIRSEREEAGLTITELRKQLNDALTRAETAEKKVKSGALEAEKRATESLQEDVDNLRIEKKLAEDRAKKEIQEARDESTRQQERAKVAELELRGEIAVSFYQRFR